MFRTFTRLFLILPAFIVLANVAVADDGTYAVTRTLSQEASTPGCWDFPNDKDAKTEVEVIIAGTEVNLRVDGSDYPGSPSTLSPNGEFSLNRGRNYRDGIGVIQLSGTVHGPTIDKGHWETVHYNRDRNQLNCTGSFSGHLEKDQQR